jgi:hypothetical protein
MPTHETYGNANQLRVLANNGAWTVVVIPQGAKHPLLSMDNINATFVMSTSNLVALTEGRFVAAARSIRLPGTETAAVTVFVNPSINTTAQVLYQTDQ